ncbi:MAG: ribonuclease P protein component [Bacteroidales bacterium]
MFEFDKQQRLCSRKSIEALFKTGKSFLMFPFSIRYSVSQGNGQIRVLIVCPKRYQKLAVNRNRIKRLIRENYRLNSYAIRTLSKKQKANIDLAISYVNKEMSDYNLINIKIKNILEKLQCIVLSLPNNVK